MAMTQYTGDTEIITNIGTTPQERGLTADQFKAKFDEGLKAFVTWFNDTHGTEFDALSASVSALTSFKVVSFSRDTSLASGTQAITGVGFKPRAVIFLGVVSGGIGRVSIGIDDGTTPKAIFDNYATTANTWDTDNKSIVCMQGSGTYYQGRVSLFDDDGFTMLWSKTGITSGTLIIHALAIK
jgi:hypothetical protein